MALHLFSVPNTVVTVNGRELTQWGQADPPVTESPIDAKSAVIRGLGGDAVRLDRVNPGRSVQINLIPGGSDASYMQALFASGANVVYIRTIIGTLENAFGDEGAIVNDGPTGRAGATSITDAQFTMEFNKWVEAK